MFWEIYKEKAKHMKTGSIGVSKRQHKNKAIADWTASNQNAENDPYNSNENYRQLFIR